MQFSKNKETGEPWTFSGRLRVTGCRWGSGPRPQGWSLLKPPMWSGQEPCPLILNHLGLGSGFPVKFSS